MASHTCTRPRAAGMAGAASRVFTATAMLPAIPTCVFTATAMLLIAAGSPTCVVHAAFPRVSLPETTPDARHATVPAPAPTTLVRHQVLPGKSSTAAPRSTAVATMGTASYQAVLPTHKTDPWNAASRAHLKALAHTPVSTVSATVSRARQHCITRTTHAVYG